jgi:hypothetical protein
MGSLHPFQKSNSVESLQRVKTGTPILLDLYSGSGPAGKSQCWGPTLWLQPSTGPYFPEGPILDPYPTETESNEHGAPWIQRSWNSSWWL